MPKIHIEDYEDDDLPPAQERIIRRPKEERDAVGKRREKTKKHRDPNAAQRKEYHEEA